MRFLLDANIILPLIDERLPRPAPVMLNLIENSTDQCVCSAASLWELAIKSRLGKLNLPCVEDALPEASEMLGIRVIPVTPSHAVTSVDPWPDTNDPFDRILLSICQVEGIRLVTTDAKLRNHPLAWQP